MEAFDLYAGTTRELTPEEQLRLEWQDRYGAVIEFWCGEFYHLKRSPIKYFEVSFDIGFYEPRWIIHDETQTLPRDWSRIEPDPYPLLDWAPKGFKPATAQFTPWNGQILEVIPLTILCAAEPFWRDIE